MDKNQQQRVNVKELELLLLVQGWTKARENGHLIVWEHPKGNAVLSHVINKSEYEKYFALFAGIGLERRRHLFISMEELIEYLSNE